MHESKDGICNLNRFLLPCLNCNSCKASLEIQLVQVVQFPKDYDASSMAALHPVHIWVSGFKGLYDTRSFSFSPKGRDGRDGTPGPAGPAGKGIGHNRCSLQILQRQIANASLSSQSCLNHTGKDGRDGRQGPKGPRGYMGLKGISGSNKSTAGKAAWSWYTDR